MANDIATLRKVLDALAQETWVDIKDGRRLGIGMGEVGITERNLLALRRAYPSLVVYKHSIREETQTGADWEWWLDTSAGWICMVFQAKILSSNSRYKAITQNHGKNKAQVDVLLQSCIRRSQRLNGAVWPLYCFYNSWQGKWPDRVPKYDGGDPGDMSPQDLQRFGCAAAGAWDVRNVLYNPAYANRHTLRDSYLPFSRPWSTLFPGERIPPGDRPPYTILTLSSLFPRERRPDILEPPLGSGLATTDRRPRRDRLAVYRNAIPVEQPPNYVLDLIEGTVRGWRLKPLARRVAILPGSG